MTTTEIRLLINRMIAAEAEVPVPDTDRQYILCLAAWSVLAQEALTLISRCSPSIESVAADCALKSFPKMEGE